MKILYPIEKPFALSISEISKALQADVNQGLTSHDAHKRNVIFGLNIYQTRVQKSVWRIILEQFMNPIVYLLVFAIVVSIYFKHNIEAISIATVLLLNALIGFLMEMQARSSMKALQEMDIIKSKVFRDGTIHEIASEKITPGDLIVLEAGDIIPADGHLVEVNQLQCDESSLTGESFPCLKNIDWLPHNTVLGDRLNMVYKGTSVMNGNGRAITTGIATNTELGKIQYLVEGSNKTKTLLDKRLHALSKKLIWISLFMTALFAVSGILQDMEWFLILETSIALSVAAFPEGLPIVATVALSYGMLLMAKRNIIVKKLSAVETLGSTNVILTDKTGTLTENKIHVHTIYLPDEMVKLSIENKKLVFNNGGIKNIENFKKLKMIGALCNNATLVKKGNNEKEIGDPLEIALIHLNEASDISPYNIQKNYTRISEIPFNANIKMMATLHRTEKGHLVAAKGAVEQLLEKCSKIQKGHSIIDLSNAERKKILTEAEKLAEEGLRVLAFAYQEGKKINEEYFLKDLVYIGSIGFFDPPRFNIKKAIRACREACIKVIMITGDHPKTALNIAKKVGLVNDNEQNVIIGNDLPEANLITKEWEKKILDCTVFARTSPKQKLDIAEIFQQAGNIIAMTGDGINDAPALNKADVGIAMGLRGTQVAKETASIVLKNDSFTSISEAVAHGREIFNNIKKFVIYLVSCNISEIFIVTTLGFLAPMSTILPLQILFLNMVTDVFPALALGMGKGDKTVMKVPPRNPKEPIVTIKNWIEIAIFSAVITFSVISTLIFSREFISKDHKILNNIAFNTLAFAQLFHVFNMASPKSKFIKNEITKNYFVWYAIIICSVLMVFVYAVPQIRLVLGLSVLSTKVWAASIAGSLIPLVLIHLYKWVKYVIQNN